MSNNQGVVFPFGEGMTEKYIFEYLMKKMEWPPNLRVSPFVVVGGTTGFRNEIPKVVSQELQPGRDIRVIAFRDIEEKEDENNIIQSFQSIISRLISGFSKQPKRVNDEPIYIWDHHGNFHFRFVVHLAKPLIEAVPLRNKTSDGYILAIGLQDAVLSRFAADINSNSDAIRSLVQNEIPKAVGSKQIDFNEARDYLAAYLVATRFWSIRRTEEKKRLIHVILERGWEDAKNETLKILCSWIKAMEEVSK